MSTVTVFPKELQFGLALGVSESKVVTLVNNSDNSAAAFKLQSNAPDRYGVRPANGVIAPMSRVEVVVRLKALESKNVGGNDKFLVRSTAIHSDALSFPSEKWSKVNKDSVTKHMLKVKFVEPGDVDENIPIDPPRVEQRRRAGSATPATQNGRFTTPRAAPPSAKAANEAGQNLQKLWNQRASAKRSEAHGAIDSPNAASRYDNAAATVGQAALLANQDPRIGLDSDKERALQLLIKDGSRRPEDKLTKEELHELIEFRGGVPDNLWDEWVATAHAMRVQSGMTPAPKSGPKPTWSGDTLFVDHHSARQSQAKSHALKGAVGMESSGKKSTPTVIKRQEIGISKNSPYLENREKNFFAASRRNTVIGRYAGVQNQKFPSTKKAGWDSVGSTPKYNQSGMRPPWEESSEFHVGATNSSVLRQVLSHNKKTGARASTPVESRSDIGRKRQVVQDFIGKQEMQGGGHRHSLYNVDKKVNYGFGVVPHKASSAVKPMPRQAQKNAAPQKASTTQSFLPKDFSLSETEKVLMEKVVAFEAKLAAAETEKRQLQLQLKEAVEGKDAAVDDLSLADLIEVNPHDLAAGSKRELEVHFDGPLGIVIGSNCTIKSVSANGAAAAKGLQAGDVIYKLAGDVLPPNLPPQELSDAILQARQESGWAEIVVIRESPPLLATKTAKASDENASNNELKSALDEARRRAVWLEAELIKCKDGMKAWDQNATLKNRLADATKEIARLKGDRDSAIQEVNVLVASVRGRNGESSVIPSHIREGFRGVRSSLKGVADVVETAFAEAGRELEAFSHRILSSAQVKRMQEDGKLRSLNVIEGASKSRFLSSQLAPTNAQASIKVVEVICRPASSPGASTSGTVIKMIDEQSLRLFIGATPRDHTFDRIFPTDTGGDKIGREVIASKLSQVIGGESVCVVVHGEDIQLGICPILYGKDDGEDKGLMNVAVDALFDRLGANGLAKSFAVSVTAVECINGMFRDLLQPVGGGDASPSHELQRDSEGNVWVSNVVGVEVQSGDDFSRVMEIAQARQTLISPSGQDVAPTQPLHVYMARGYHLNPRANVVFTVQLELMEEHHEAKSGSNICFSRMTFVHLGSGKGAQETLTGMNDVLVNIAAENDYVPFRHSKLTRMLEPAFPHKKSSAIVILSVSTAEDDVVDTNRSLLFGQRLVNMVSGRSQYGHKLTRSSSDLHQTGPWK